MGRQEAFEIYRRDYPQQRAIDQHKAALKELYARAKKLGLQVNTARSQISMKYSSKTLQLHDGFL